MKGIIFITSLSAAVASVFFYLFPSAILVLFSHSPSVLRFRQTINHRLNQIYFEFAAFLVFSLCGVRVFLHTTDAILSDHSFLVICNHRCTVDMIFTAWCYATFFDTYPHFLFILKDALRSLPFFGYCMQILMYIFLSRKKTEDVPHIHSVLNYMSKHYCAEQSVVIFPEGTDLSASNIKKNTMYAESKGLPVLKQVMYPRPAGFLTLIGQYQACLARNQPAIRYLHDMTLAYKDNIKGERTTHKTFLQGRFPSEVHIYVKRYAIDKLPSDPVALEQWLVERFHEKEKLLEAFYSNDEHLLKTYGLMTSRLNVTRTRAHALLMVVLVAGLVAALYWFQYVRYAALVYLGVFVVLSYCGGFDRLVLSMG